MRIALTRSLGPALLLAGFVLLSAAASSPALAGKADDTLIFAIPEEVQNMDTYYDTSRYGMIFSRLVYDSLLYRNPVSGEYEGMLATDWRWVDDTTLEFDLRKGVTFHNGEPFDADDVVYTINYIINPDSKVMSRKNVEWIKGVEKLGPYKVRILANSPFPPAPEYLAGPIPMYPNEYYAKVGSAGMSTHPVGCGPYKFVAAASGETITLEKFENYYDGSPQGKPAIGKLVMRMIADFNTQVAELMTGGIDWMWRVDRDQSKILKDMPQIKVVSDATMRVGYLSIDVIHAPKGSPLADVRVRKAMAHAINKQALVDNLVAPGAKLLCSACAPSQFGCEQNVTCYDYDPAKAKALLAEAGFPGGGFTVVLDAYRKADQIQAMAADLAKVGITLEMSMGKYASVRDKLRSGKSQISMMDWGSYSINDVSASTGNFFRGGPDDTYGDAEVKAWLDAAANIADASERKALYSKALKKIADQVYWIPTWLFPLTYAFNAELDFTPYPDEIPRFALAKWN